jgi:UDP-N-acetylmuramoyl-tripeptide--D-alanyl-D-alanine ligase
VLTATGGLRARIGARDHDSYQAVCTDPGDIIEGCLFVALKGKRLDGHDFLFEAVEDGATGLVVQKDKLHVLPRHDVAVYAVDDTLKALGKLVRLQRKRFKIPIGAVTGSNGKTTTKELIATILREISTTRSVSRRPCSTSIRATPLRSSRWA